MQDSITRSMIVVTVRDSMFGATLEANTQDRSRNWRLVSLWTRINNNNNKRSPGGEE